MSARELVPAVFGGREFERDSQVLKQQSEKEDGEQLHTERRSSQQCPAWRQYNRRARSPT
ncbi:hypothetical protein [Bradyrhizobium lablabi]|uniref:hypothetical protein n=1 Tax=Bradyrhizobium lablabi TaxID=722472 RepID=UPI00155F9A29|nr:hypothetical protein [Bradyrhizobium lablabi]